MSHFNIFDARLLKSTALENLIAYIWHFCVLKNRITVNKSKTATHRHSESEFFSSTIPTSHSPQTSHRQPGADAERYLTKCITRSSRRTNNSRLNPGCTVSKGPLSSSCSSSLLASSADSASDRIRSLSPCGVEP